MKKTNTIPIEEKISRVFKKKKKTLALAESCTGGLTSSRITDVPGSSDYFTGGVVAYSNKVKEDVLFVPSLTIKKYGAVSSQVAKAMAKGVRGRLGTDIAAAITGIAGPFGGTRAKPVGTAYIAYDNGIVQRSRKIFFKGNREEVKRKFADAVLKLIEENA